jgi:hypothetical protein
VADHVHQRWIFDFKVDICLADGQWVHMHTVRDPVGAAFIGAKLYLAPGKKSRVTLEQARATLRTCFVEGGMPEEVQTDWEPSLHSQAGDTFPSLFTLWLEGLGIHHRHCRPGVPTDDAEVERGHRTLYDYGLYGHLDEPFETLQQRLETARYELNHEYPSRAHGCDGRPAFQAHPELLHPPRLFDPQQELAFFDLHRVDTYLASLCFERKVGKCGQVNLGGQHVRYSVGRQFAGQVVLIRFDPTNRTLVAFLNEQEIARWQSKYLDVQDIVGFGQDTQCYLPQQLPLPFLPTQVLAIELLQV